MKYIILPTVLFVWLFIPMAGHLARGAEKPVFRDYPVQALSVRDGLPNFITVLQKGTTARIAFYGSQAITGYPLRKGLTDRLASENPNVKFDHFEFVVANSESGVYRLETDILCHDPDLLVLDFAALEINAPPERLWRHIEGIIRKTWRKSPTTDILFVHSYKKGNEKSPQTDRCLKSVSAIESLADFYRIPSVNLQTVTVKGGSQQQVIDVISDLFEEAKKQHSSNAKGDHTDQLRATFYSGNLEQATCIAVMPDMCTGKWFDDIIEGQVRPFYVNAGMPVWSSSTPGNRLTFRFTGSSAKILDLMGPDGARIRITVDGKCRQDSVSRKAPTYRLDTFVLCENLNPSEKHEVSIEILPTEFSEKGASPTLFRPAKIMLIGTP